MIHLKFLPARFGDCIWIEYGDDQKTHRILIDGGTAGTRHDIKKLLNALPENERKLELLVVTHIDRDHIEGILKMFEEKDELPFEIDDFWFNSWNHLPQNNEDEHFGAVQGERLTVQILKHQLNWNKKFNGKAIVVENDELPKVELPGGMKLTILSPAPEHLAELKDKWEEEVLDANLNPGFSLAPNDEEEEDEQFGVPEIPDVNALVQEEFHEDEAAGNGSSIAFLAEFNEKKILFCGDAFPTQLVKALDIISPDEKLKLDLFKVSHHASSHNTSQELLDKVDCKNFVISTNGSIFKHPKAVTISRIIKSTENANLIFNYKSAVNKIWALPSLINEFNYTAVYPEENGKPVKVDII